MAIDTTSPRTRRAILLGALGGVAATVAAAVGRAQPAQAGEIYIVKSAENREFAPTQITNTNTSGFGSAGLVAWGTGLAPGVSGYGPKGSGVFGTSFSGNGVQGETHGPHGSGVVGTNQQRGNGVVGQSNARPIGVNGLSAAGTVGQNTADGAGVWGLSVDGVGVVGQSMTGRGGLFRGAAAQIRLQPSSAANHPATGQPGDLFVDDTHRLWFCTEGGNPATWKRVQLV